MAEAINWTRTAWEELVRRAEVVETGRTPAEVRIRLGVVCGVLAVVVYALTQAVTLPLLPTLLLVCSFGPLLTIGSAGLWELLGLHRRTATWTSAWSPTSRPGSRSP